MFRLGQHELESRVNLILTLFLAATAFQFVVGESLPKVGYLTYMDSYLMIHNLTHNFFSENWKMIKHDNFANLKKDMHNF